MSAGRERKLLCSLCSVSPDIDECRSNGTALCDTEVTGRNCSNTPGSYQCLCPEGFYYHEEEHLCKGLPIMDRSKVEDWYISK